MIDYSDLKKVSIPVFRFNGTVKTKEDLPKEAKSGEYKYCIEDNSLYVYLDDDNHDNGWEVLIKLRTAEEILEEIKELLRNEEGSLKDKILDIIGDY